METIWQEFLDLVKLKEVVVQQEVNLWLLSPLNISSKRLEGDSLVKVDGGKHASKEGSPEQHLVDVVEHLGFVHAVDELLNLRLLFFSKRFVQTICKKWKNNKLEKGMFDWFVFSRE